MLRQNSGIKYLQKSRRPVSEWRDFFKANNEKKKPSYKIYDGQHDI